MSFGGLILTNAGRNKIAGAISEDAAVSFTHVKLGDGTYNGSFSSITELSNEVMEIPITNITRKNNEVTIDCDWNSRDAPVGFYLREIGIIGNNALCYYDNAGPGDAEYIDPESKTVSKQKRLRFTLIISEEVNVTTNISSNLYALEEEVTQELAELDSKKIDRNEISSWAKRSEKPVYTKEEIGLGNVENTADLDKPISNDTQAALNEVAASANQFTLNKIAELINGAPETLDTLKEVADAITENKTIVDALDAAIGTKANASDLTSHTTNKSNPHGVTKAQLGLGNVENKTSATIRSELTQANVTTALGYTPPTTNTTYVQATASTLGLVKLYTDTGESTDGTMTRKAITQEIDNLLGMVNENTAWINKKSGWALVYETIKTAQNSGFNISNYIASNPTVTEFNIMAVARGAAMDYAYNYSLSVATLNNFSNSKPTTVLCGYAAGTSYTGRAELVIRKPYIYLGALYVNTEYTSDAVLRIYAR